MGIKYLLRGIGIGIILTAIVLGSIYLINAKEDGKPQNTSASGLTTPETTAEDNSLKKILEQSQSENTIQPTEETTDASSEATIADTPEQKNTNTNSQTSESYETTARSDQTEEDEVAAVGAHVRIVSGMNCSKLSKLLEEEGLVVSAEAFSKYMETNGYDNRLRAGDYTVTSNMTFEELAKLFTARK